MSFPGEKAAPSPLQTCGPNLLLWEAGPMLPGSCIFVSSICLYKGWSFPAFEAGVVQGRLERREGKSGGGAGAGKGGHSPATPSAVPDLFPRRSDPPGAAMGGEVTVHRGRDLVLQEPRCCHE